MANFIQLPSLKPNRHLEKTTFFFWRLLVHHSISGGSMVDPVGHPGIGHLRMTTKWMVSLSFIFHLKKNVQKPGRILFISNGLARFRKRQRLLWMDVDNYGWLWGAVKLISINLCPSSWLPMGWSLGTKSDSFHALGVYVWTRADSYLMYPCKISPYSGRKKTGMMIIIQELE